MTGCVIDLGLDAPCDLRVRVIPGLAWTSPAMTRASGQPWPAPPRLAMSGQSWTATLSGDGLTAVIAATAEQTAATKRGEAVALRDDDTVYALGHVRHVEGVPT